MLILKSSSFHPATRALFPFFELQFAILHRLFGEERRYQPCFGVVVLATWNCSLSTCNCGLVRHKGNWPPGSQAGVPLDGAAVLIGYMGFSKCRKWSLPSLVSRVYVQEHVNYRASGCTGQNIPGEGTRRSDEGVVTACLVIDGGAADPIHTE
jgi:hypothetical protein